MQVRRRGGAAADIDGGENSPVHGHEVRGEGDDDWAAGSGGELLVELGHVAVMADAIGVEALRHLREQHLLPGCPTRAGHARLGVDYDLVGVDRLRPQQRDERQLCARGETSGLATSCARAIASR